MRFDSVVLQPRRLSLFLALFEVTTQDPHPAQKLDTPGPWNS